MVYAVAAPVRLTFYAEVVVRLARQCAVAAVGFEYALCERYAGRDAVTLHVFDGDALISVDVLLLGDAGLSRELRGRGRKREKREVYCFFGKNHYLCVTVKAKIDYFT